MRLADQVKPIVNEILALLARSHPQWRSTANFTIVGSVFEIVVQDIETGEKYQLKYTNFDAATLLKSPRNLVAEVNVHYIIKNAQATFAPF